MVSVLFGTRQQLEIAGEISMKIGNDNITTTNTAQNLGMIIDNHLKGTRHINKLASSTFVPYRTPQKSVPSWHADNKNDNASIGDVQTWLL